MSDVLVKKLFLTVRRLEVPSSDTWRLTAIVDGETVSKGLRVPVAPLDEVASGLAEEDTAVVGPSVSTKVLRNKSPSSISCAFGDNSGAGVLAPRHAPLFHSIGWYDSSGSIGSSSDASACGQSFVACSGAVRILAPKNINKGLSKPRMVW